MNEQLAEARRQRSATYDEMRSLVRSLSDEDLGRRTDNGWTVRQMAGHIASSGNGDIFVINRVRKGKNATLPSFLAFAINGLNYMGARKFRNATRDDIVAALDEQERKVDGVIDTLQDDELQQRGKCLGMGELTLLEYLQRSGEHPREHAASIKTAVGAPAR